MGIPLGGDVANRGVAASSGGSQADQRHIGMKPDLVAVFSRRNDLRRKR
jgi:hypothetical protein